MGRVVDGDQARRTRDGEGAVVDSHPPERIERDAEQVAEIDADHAAVRDDQNVLTVSVVRGDPIDRLQHAGADLRQWLAAGRRAIERRPHPGEARIALTGAHLLDGAALPLAQRQLAELVNPREWNP